MCSSILLLSSDKGTARQVTRAAEGSISAAAARRCMSMTPRQRREKIPVGAREEREAAEVCGRVRRGGVKLQNEETGDVSGRSSILNVCKYDFQISHFGGMQLFSDPAGGLG